MSTLRSIFPPHIVDTITKIPISFTGHSDNLVWHHNKNGVISVKSAYNLAVSSTTTHKASASSSFVPNRNLWKVCWKLKIPNKIKVFWWRCLNNAIATKENLCLRLKFGDGRCPRCNSSLETIEHSFLNCQTSILIWEELSDWIEQPDPYSPSVIRWISGLCDSNDSSELLSGKLCKIELIFWQIWLNRNDFLFNNKTTSPLNSRSAILQLWRLCEEHLHNSTPHSVCPPILNPIPPSGMVLISDGSLDISNNRAAIASILLRDNTIIDGISFKVSTSSVLSCEAQALRAGLRMANNFNPSKLWVGSDSKQLISLLNNREKSNWECDAIIEDIKAWSSSLDVSFHFVPRIYLGYVDWLAKATLRGALRPDWITALPPQLDSFLPVGGSSL
jgi:ribonuclease HI